MEKILFICSGNVCRSQIAEAFYNYYTKSKNGFSAGTNPETPFLYPKIPDEICKMMAEEGISISEQKVKLVDEKMVDAADKIFIMCEKECCPDFLLNSGKINFWNVKDPFNASSKKLIETKDIIREKVLTII